LVDCITPLVANLFYVLIAFCFVIVIKSTLACILSIISAPPGFISWLKRNTVLEISSSKCCILAMCPFLLVTGIPQQSFFYFSKFSLGLAVSAVKVLVLAILACIITVIAGILVYSAGSFSDVTVGIGLILIALSGVSALFAAVVGLRRTFRLARQRRLENQRLLCARSLRSWREVGRRPEDSRPIIDFERYLDTCATPADAPWEPFPLEF
uniref:TMEM127 domain-containing protein n=1 Tax=Gongylonema pulchrum TaxID=637853 RepID=A0A183EFA7_9BILA